MNWADVINGSFELVGGLLICLSIRQLFRDKVVRGVSAWPVTFFAAWGFWNLFYYPNLDQWFSFAGGLVIVTANAVWVGQMFYYHATRMNRIVIKDYYGSRTHCDTCFRPYEKIT